MRVHKVAMAMVLALSLIFVAVASADSVTTDFETMTPAVGQRTGGLAGSRAELRPGGRGSRDRQRPGAPSVFGRNLRLVRRLGVLQADGHDSQ